MITLQIYGLSHAMHDPYNQAAKSGHKPDLQEAVPVR